MGERGSIVEAKDTEALTFDNRIGYTASLSHAVEEEMDVFNAAIEGVLANGAQQGLSRFSSSTFSTFVAKQSSTAADRVVFSITVFPPEVGVTVIVGGVDVEFGGVEGAEVTFVGAGVGGIEVG